MTRIAPKHPSVDIDCEMLHPILVVPDVEAAVTFYTEKLGFWVAFTEGHPARFAGVNLGHVQLFLERGAPTPQGCGVYFVVDDVDRLFRFHQSRGVNNLELPELRPYGLRDYTVTDRDGYRLTFGERVGERRS